MNIGRWLGACAAAYFAFGCASEPSDSAGKLGRAHSGLTVADCPAGHQIILGSPGDDVLIGTSGNDCILGFAGNDRIDGRGGEDVLSGGSGDDEILGGPGDDRIYGDEGNDDISGGVGDDLLEGGDGNDRINGGVGADTIVGGSGDDLIDAGVGTDQVNGGDGNDQIAGGAGKDTIDGGGGNDAIDGGVGGDTVNGGDGNDVIAGGNNDTVDGGGGNDSCSGGGCESPTPTDCSGDADCPAGQRCLATSGVCVACAGDAECSDGLFCNGAETCVPVTGCVAGAAPVLDDGNACTIDSCDEASDAIVHELRDADADGTCDDLDGCPNDPAKISPGVCGCGFSDADGDGDGFAACLDCDDGDAAARPGLIEVCDGVDNDCSGVVDEGTEAECDDGNECTDDACGGAAGCSSVSVADGTSCAGGNGVCGAGACDIDQCASAPCEHGGTCTDLGDSFECACRFGYGGTRCENDVPAFLALATPSAVVLASGVSADGRTVVGRDQPDPLAGMTAVYFDLDAEAIAPVSIGSGSLEAANADGSVLAGGLFLEEEKLTTPFVYERESGSATLFPIEGTLGRAVGISADGSIVAVSNVPRANGKVLVPPPSQPYAWPLGADPIAFECDGKKGCSLVNGISADGGTLVGAFPKNSVRWDGDDFSARTALGFGVAHAASADASVIVGLDQFRGPSFRWTATNGAAPLGGDGFIATATNADGSVLAGSNGDVAMIWDATARQRLVHEVLTQAGVELDGWQLREAVGISGDGTVVVGNGSNPTTLAKGAWVARLPRASVDDCAAEPCQNGGTCREATVGYFCDCPVGFDGVDCELADPCDPNLCQNGGTCVLSVPDVSCACPDGFTGTHCELDVDECELNNGFCDPLTTCTNTFGGRTCGDCPPGYAGDGESGCMAGCTTPADCPAPPGATPTCTGSDGSGGSGGGGGVAGSGGFGGTHTGGCGGEFPCDPPSTGGAAGTGGSGGGSVIGVCGYDTDVEAVRVWPDIPNAGAFLSFWAGPYLNAHESRVDVTTGTATPLAYPPPSGFAHGLKRQSIWIDSNGVNRMSIGHHENVLGHDLDSNVIGSWIRFGCCQLAIDRVLALDSEQGYAYFTGAGELFELDLTTFAPRRVIATPGLHSGYHYVDGGVVWIGGDGKVGRVDLGTGVASVTSVLPPRGYYLPPGGISSTGGLVLPTTTGELLRFDAAGDLRTPIVTYLSPNPAWSGWYVNDGGTPQPMPTLVLANGLVLVNTGDPSVTAFDELTGDVVWQTSTSVVVTALLLGDGNVVYAYESEVGRILGIDLETGQVRYRFDGAPPSVPGHPVDMALRDGVLYVTASSRLMAIEVPSLGYPEGGWPTLFHDNQRTSNRATAFD